MAVRPAFRPLSDFQPSSPGYQLLPFRFARIPGIDGKVLAVTEAGEHLFLTDADLRALAGGTLDPASDVYADLEAKHFLTRGDSALAIRMTARRPCTMPTGRAPAAVRTPEPSPPSNAYATLWGRRPYRR